MRELDREALMGLARLAGQAILECRAGGLEVAIKDDGTPVTQADKRAGEILAAGLAHIFPGLPVICEETANAPYEERRRYERCFIVDPLDGTKEFAAGRDDFCVCLALVEAGRPVYGVIAAPAADLLYAGGPGVASRRRSGDGPAQALRVRRPGPGETIIAMASRSHPSPGLAEWLARFGAVRAVSRGSALKFCALAEGACHVYPRLGPTSEWDVAAGHALVLGAGGAMTALDGGPFPYNKPEFVNGPFLAHSLDPDDPRLRPDFVACQ
jgi:3'(2'), 5'-bisphosphate nucleotidase